MKPTPGIYADMGEVASVFLPLGSRRKRFLRNRDGDNCWICGLEMDFGCDSDHPNAATVDHVIPSSRGGADARTNLKLAHKNCNCERGRKDGIEQRTTASAKCSCVAVDLKGQTFNDEMTHCPRCRKTLIALPAEGAQEESRG